MLEDGLPDGPIVFELRHDIRRNAQNRPQDQLRVYKLFNRNDEME